MTFYFAMINAWRLAREALNGTMDEEYPIIDTSVGAGNTAAEKTNRYDNDGLDYEVDLFDGASADYLADIDDQRAHHFTNANSPYNDGWTREYHQKELEKMDLDFYEPKRNHQYKYHDCLLYTSPSPRDS